uniref:Uncharacterized protein n=1 Tax=Arundo donax TaxID=35708 RepID=A0A0A9FJL3_ARUDO
MLSTVHLPVLPVSPVSLTKIYFTSCAVTSLAMYKQYILHYITKQMRIIFSCDNSILTFQCFGVDFHIHGH